MNRDLYDAPPSGEPVPCAPAEEIERAFAEADADRARRKELAADGAEELPTGEQIAARAYDRSLARRIGRGLAEEEGR